MLRLLPTVLILAVWIYAFIDCLNTPEDEVRKLPKLAWVFIIVLFGSVLFGPIAWFLAGRPRRNAPYGATRSAERRWVAPDDNPDFLKSINERGRQRPETPEPERKREPESGEERGRRDGRKGGSAGSADREADRENGGPEDTTPPAAS
ncbi:PLD nuclease N-terminal domain-containing protein [Streptomyces sp. CNQ085]|uniref:PLD nuclease N-terminal domain-containing protein n=1 Tax=Streptomyces sp. CNQ085 TaxID=2886944 RepID=UPI001F512BA9|nr:PLD nuclease N-terminal domain-containing protein [Streptomyces sp. CNQ085]MCI0384092.1 PLD nuclease N-terminal domain-containing protein [Streptomyces sp. CNQ085]